MLDPDSAHPSGTGRHSALSAITPPVAISILVLISVRVTPLNNLFPWIEKQGLTIGIII